MQRLRHSWLALLAAGCLGLSAQAQSPAPSPAVGAAAAERFANLALKCLHDEYPNHVSLYLESDAEAQPPHVLFPAFYGCYDWHSAVHGHWLLARLLRLYPQAPYAGRARAALAKSFTPEAIGGEIAFMKRPGRASFERPYGLAWVLMLSLELRESKNAQAATWLTALQPLEAEVAARLKAYLPKLHYPIRVGEHDQTAFSLGLVWDWAGVTGDTEMHTLLTNAALRFYHGDTDCPLKYEPSGEDFLSPCLGEADFMRRVLEPAAFAPWLKKFLPTIPLDANGTWLAPGVVTDRADPKLAHIDGLNLSRSWMLEGIAHGLPAQDRRRAALTAAARRHRDAALPNVTGEHYEGGHWLGTFAIYLTTQAGLR